MSQVGTALGLVAAVVLVAACAQTPAKPTSDIVSPSTTLATSPGAPSPSQAPSATPTASASPANIQPSPIPTPCASEAYPLPGLCSGVVGRVPTAAEYAAMVAVGSAGIEKSLGYKDWSACSNGQTCFKAAGTVSAAMVGTNAGVFDGGFGVYPGGGLGAACWVFVYLDAGGWHYLNSGCAQNPGFVPGSADSGTHVYVSGCANVRDTPSLSGKVLACLGNGSVVNVDSAPVYRDGHMWWHLTGKGWMAHDFLCEICRI